MSWRDRLAWVVSASLFVGGLVIGGDDAVRLLAQAVAQPPEPELPGHCSCTTGTCALEPNGRACSCGCVLRADRQAAATTAAESDQPCSDAGRAGAYPCRDVDLLSSLPLAEMGGTAGNDIWGWTDPESGREYALVGLSSGTAFVDVTEPRQPRWIGTLPTATSDSTWRDMKVFGNYVFVVSEAPNHGLQVFDLTRLREVESPPQTFDENARYTGFGSAHNLAVNEATGIAYAVGTRTCGGGLHMVDIGNPTSPQAAGCFSQDGYTHDAQCVVYRGPDRDHDGREVCFNSNEDTLTIVDVTDKHDARLLSRTGYDASAYTHQGWLTTDQRYFLVDDELDERSFGRPTRTFLWDVSDLDAPFIRKIYEGSVGSVDHNLYVRGDLVYEANYRSGLRVLELGDVESDDFPREVGYFDIYPADDAPSFNGAWSVFPYFASRNVVVNGIEQGLFVVRPRRPPTEDGVGLQLSFARAGAPRADASERSFVVRVHNDGPAPATDVSLTVQLPAGVSVRTPRSIAGPCSVTSLITCNVGRLAVGATAIATFAVITSEPRDVVATALVTAGASSPSALGARSATLQTHIARPTRAAAITSPVEGSTWVVNRVATVQWTLRGVAGNVRVELSSDDGGTWGTIATSTPNTGFLDFGVTAALRSTRCRVRVTSVTDPSLSATSQTFAIQ